MNWFTYDFFDPSSAYAYWTAQNGAPPLSYIKGIATELTARFGIITCNNWSDSDYIGGLRTMGARTCVFRVLNGGRDRRGRPHRWVLFVAETEAGEWQATDILEALESPVFQQYAKTAVPSPVPMPSAIPKWPLHPQKSGALPDQLSLTGDDSRQQISKYSLVMTSGPENNSLLVVEKQGTQYRAWIKDIKKASKTEKTYPPTPIPPHSTTLPHNPDKILSGNNPYSSIKMQFSLKTLLILTIIGFICGLGIGYFFVKNSNSGKEVPRVTIKGQKTDTEGNLVITIGVNYNTSLPSKAGSKPAESNPYGREVPEP